MYTYTPIQWILFFYIYCFVGWGIESTIVSIEEKRLVNRGFLRGPCLPIYGCGAMVILFVTIPVRSSPFLVYVLGMLGTSVLEYVTSFLMEVMLKTKYWDYSNDVGNINGRVCLRASLFWGLLSIFLTDFLHSFTEHYVLMLSDAQGRVTVIVVSVIFTADTAYAFKTAFDVKKVLARVTELKAQISELSEQLEAKLDENEHVAAARAQLNTLRTELSSHVGGLGFFGRNLLNSYPHAVSKHFDEALEYLRSYSLSRKDK